MAYIYKITNDVNGKIYIGKTYNSIEKRFKEHCRERLRDGHFPCQVISYFYLFDSKRL